MEHCQLMLLLLNMFPQKIGYHGVKLIETLFSAEKHGHYQSPVNGYRQLLGKSCLKKHPEIRETKLI